MNQRQQEINNQTEQTEITKLKLLLGTNAAFTKWKKLTNASMNRYYRLRELITTEGDYFNDLRTLQEKIKMPLIQSKIISKNKAKQMFTDLENMMLLSKQIKNGLQKKFESWNCKTTLIGQYMSRYSKFLLLYSGYFNNLAETQRKMKQLSQINPEIRELEKSLSTSEKIVTIEDLIIKPLQRPLKYSIILKDYCAKLSESHADYLPVKNAIAEYHKVNEQNNLQMQNKMKDDILIQLDIKYGNIIKSEARYYVTQYKALLIQVPVILYVLSDLIILVNEATDKENIRVYLNKHSFLALSKNQKTFQNGLFLYGERRCVYLRFENQFTRDQVYFSLKTQINFISQNQFQREKILAERLNRQTVQQTQKMSILEAQFVRPLIATVVGFQKRKISQNKIKGYYVIEFKASPKEREESCLPQQLSFINWQTLQQIQLFVIAMYPNSIRFFPLSYLPKGITAQSLENDEILKFQIQTIFIQIFLNSIFRSETILKRIDIICKKLDICDALWKHLGSPYSQLCFCNYCIEERFFKSFDDYDHEIHKRIRNKEAKESSGGQKMFCEIRTINSQLMVSRLQSSELSTTSSVQRIAWVKGKKGFINHSLTNIIPNSVLIQPITIRIWFYSYKGRDNLELQVSPFIRIKQIIDKIGKYLGFDISDYGLEVLMGERTYLLNDDEILGNIYHKYHEHEGIISKFFSIFTADDYIQTFYLKKIWVLQPELQKACEIQKLIFQVEQVIWRLRTEQIRLAQEETFILYGNYFAYLYYSELDGLKLGHLELKKEEFLFLLPPKFKDKKCLSIVYSKVMDIQADRRLKKYNLLKNILSIVESKPGWSCVMFKAKQRTKEGLYLNQVRIGCDIQGLIVRFEKKCGVKYVFKFQDSQWSHRIIGDELIIRTSEKQYSFLGIDLWKVHQHFQFYQIYYRYFRRLRLFSKKTI